MTNALFFIAGMLFASLVAYFVFRTLLSSAAKSNAEALRSQKELFDKSVAEMKASVNATTEKLLTSSKVDFSETSTKRINELLSPFRDRLKEMKDSLDTSKLSQEKLSSSMEQQIRLLLEQTSLTAKSADALTNALKHGSKVQGDWGERILDELLESQHLIRGIHYDVQAVIKDSLGNPVHGENGRIMRPDVILHLDQQRDVIIDSKVSLTAFIDYVNAETETDRQLYLKQHLDSLWQHVRELQEKDYASYIQPPHIKMDYVIMFVPNTGALWTALNAQPDLWRKAMELNVFIADEQTLFAALRIINLTWTQIQQAENHQRVYELADQMIERVGMFVKQYEKMGEVLQKAQSVYDEGKKKLDPQGQSILTTAHNLCKLGAKTNKSYPLPPSSI